MAITSALGRSIKVSTPSHNQYSKGSSLFHIHISAGIKAVNSTMVEVPCQCGQSTVKRYTGKFCGPRRLPCTRTEKNADDPVGTLENVWVDGNNTFYHKKSDIKDEPWGHSKKTIPYKHLLFQMLLKAYFKTYVFLVLCCIANLISGHSVQDW